MLRIGLIGCGDHARRFHAPALGQYRDQHPDRIELSAACDVEPPKAEDFCRQFSFARAYDDLEQMLGVESLDAALATVPYHQVVPVSCRLLEAGVPTLIEKPLGRSLDEARSLVDAAERTGTKHMVSVNRRFCPYLRAVRDWTRKTGPVRYARATMLRHKRREESFIWTTAIHAVDTLVALGGNIRSDLGECIRTAEMTTRWWRIALEFEDGGPGEVEILPTAGTLVETYEVFGEGYRAAAEIPGADGYRARAWQDKQLQLDVRAPADEPVFVSNGSYQEVVEFVAMLRADPYEGPTVSDVMPASQVCFRLAKTTRK